MERSEEAVFENENKKSSSGLHKCLERIAGLLARGDNTTAKR